MGVLFLLLLSLSLQLVLFVPAFLLRTDKLTDLSYSLSFVVLAAVAFWSSARSLAHAVLLVMVCLWAARLGVFLFARVLRTGRDARFDGIRSRFWKFLGFWVAQGVVVWGVLLAALIFFSSGAGWGLWSWLGLLVFSAGLVLESVADAQQWRARRRGKGLFTGGLWRYSRHPNYFGEMLVWIGVFLFSLPALGGARLVLGLASPAIIISTLLFFSGAPTVERRLRERYKGRYARYQRRTSMIVPWPPKK